MALKRSKYFTGMGQPQVPTPHKAGTVQVVLFTHVFTEAVGTSDVLEIVPVPPNAKIVGLGIIGANLTGNAKVGFVSGVPGTPDDTRTLGSELFSAQSLTAEGNVPLATLAGLSYTKDTPVSIGLTPATAIAAGATNKVIVKLEYTATE